MTQENSLPNAGLPRRLGAMLYDALLVVASWMIVTALFLPWTRGEAITPGASGALEYLYRIVLLAVLIAFFGFFWTRKGQTLGMAAWRLKVMRFDGARMTWRDVVLRISGAFVSASIFALGYLWIIASRDRLAWHDRWSKTKVVVTPKKSAVPA
jgi:uncharacterized RDD family membrane protein YckC